MAEILRGIGASPGMAVGPVARLGFDVAEPSEGMTHSSAGVEEGRALGALATVANELETTSCIGEVGREVLETQALMARDPALVERIRVLTAAARSAERAVWEALNEFRDTLLAGRPYLAARGADLSALRDRVVAVLLGHAPLELPNPGHPFVLIARDLAPADAATLPADRVLALVTEEGGPTSHTAILARSLGVPAVVACSGIEALVDGTPLLVDGTTGEVRINPGPQEVAQAALAGTPACHRLTFAAYADGPGGGGGVGEGRAPGRTVDGVAVDLLANLGHPRDADHARAVGATGVGLLRTEFLFLGRATPPSLEEQVASYRHVFSVFPDSRVIVRVLDAGADKALAFLPSPVEPNPALGVRGLRALQRSPQTLEVQLAALARAAKAEGTQAWAMAPMVATTGEAEWFRDAVRAAGVARCGIMVEVPAAALRAQDLLQVVDFASLGTNDLVQYTMAADRLLGSLATFQDPWEPALLDLVVLTVRAGRVTDRLVGVCGEAASDPVLALVFVGLGVRSLSMAPAAIPGVREALAAVTSQMCEQMARAALAARSAREGRETVQDILMASRR